MYPPAPIHLGPSSLPCPQFRPQNLGDAQIINVFLVTTIAGTLLDTVSEIVEEPARTFTILGEALPKVSGVEGRVGGMLRALCSGVVG